MSAPAKTMRPASGASMPEIWLISVVLPAPFGPITACSSPGIDVERDVVGDDKAAEALAQVVEAQHGSATASLRASSRPMPTRPPRANSTTSTSSGPKITFQCSVTPDEPFLQQQEGRRADDRAVQRADAAEHDHEDQFARALPGHVGGADELGLRWRAGSRTARRACRRSHRRRAESGRTSKPIAAMRIGFSRAPRNTRPKREATMARQKQIAAEQAGEARHSRSAVVLEQREARRSCCAHASVRPSSPP